MSNFKPIIIAATIGFVAAPAAFATSGLIPATGEAAFTVHVMPAGEKTRQQVLAELQAFKKNPIATDGWRYVGGEAGWAYEGHKYDRRGGRWVHVDTIDHNTPKPNVTMTPQERQRYRQLNAGG